LQLLLILCRLSKLYIATTAPGNTYGAFLSTESLEVEEYINKMMELGERVRRVDPGCGSLKMLEASVRLKEWVENYKINHPSIPVHNYLDTTFVAPENLLASAGDIDWTLNALADEEIDFGTEGLFHGF
jgi:hypothetical protein